MTIDEIKTKIRSNILNNPWINRPSEGQAVPEPYLKDIPVEDLFEFMDKIPGSINNYSNEPSGATPSMSWKTGPKFWTTVL